MMLEVQDLRVAYGKIEALKGISFTVDEGEIVTLVGANDNHAHNFWFAQRGGWQRYF